MKWYKLRPRDPALKVRVGWSGHTNSFCAQVINHVEGKHVMTLGFIQNQCVNLDDFVIRLKPHAYVNADIRAKLEKERATSVL